MRLIDNRTSRGSFVAFYGANNLGKSTQIAKVVSRLVEQGHQSFLLIKYPIYELPPTGPRINNILRGRNDDNIDPKSLDMQKLYAQNRIDFQPALIELLNSGIDVLCEDYVGTGIAWGKTWDLTSNDLENLNYGLIRPDYEILLDGRRFKTAIEKGHKFEDTGSTVWNKNRYEFLTLAEKYNWKVFNANEDEKTIHNKIWEYILPAFSHSLQYKKGK